MSKRKLTTRQEKYVSGKLAGKTSARAAREAGYAESVARKADAIIGASPAVQRKLRDLLEGVGVTQQLLARRMREGLDAIETKVFQRRFAADGNELISVDCIDYGERRAMVQLCLEYLGLKPAERHHHEMGLDMLLGMSYRTTKRSDSDDAFMGP
jgi:hypothetical protein